MTQLTDRQKCLLRVLQILGVEYINPEDNNNSIICQKSIYLLQCKGISLGYAYEWRVRGPYSPALGNDLYDLSQYVKEQNIRMCNIDNILCTERSPARDA